MYHFELHLKARSSRPSALLVYTAIISSVFFIARSRVQHAVADAAESTPVFDFTTTVEAKPFFSLSTNRTFASSENPRLWLDYRNVESLDFRVYRVSDPQAFFARLSDPHQLGEDEQDEVAPNPSNKPAPLATPTRFEW